MRQIGAALAALAVAAGCTTAGSRWMAQPLSGNDDDWGKTTPASSASRTPASAPGKVRPQATPKTRVIGDDAPDPPPGEQAPAAPAPERAPQGAKTEGKVGDSPKVEGKVLGSFRNTYYDFPSEGDFEGDPVDLKDARCKTIKPVPRGFYEAVCVQGSGTLASGTTVSFAKRDCDCALTCPRTGQHICFDELDARHYPWGRGATGNSITPLLTVAVDTDVIPLNTAIYIPEFDGLPRDVGQTAIHDGCFIAQDRGIRVKGKQVDVFTGDNSVTKLWNQLVPSNKGVTIVVDNPRCARATQ